MIAPQFASVPPEPATSRVAVSSQAKPTPAQTLSHELSLVAARNQQLPPKHTGGVTLTMSFTHVPTAPSITPASPVTTQPPFVSAFPIAVLNFVSAAVRQAGSAFAAPEVIAFCQHLSLALTFFAAAFCLATAHFCAGVALAWMTPAVTVSARAWVRSGLRQPTTRPWEPCRGESRASDDPHTGRSRIASRKPVYRGTVAASW